jgi:hypothetical protein
MQHLIKDKANCPDITFRGVGHCFEKLCCHVEGSSNSSVALHLPPAFLSKTKITKLNFLLGDKNVGRLKIAMKNSFFD